MVTKIELRGYEEFKSYADAVDSKGPKAIFYFTGSKLSNGTSWCPDCVEAEPVVITFMSQIKNEVIFGLVDVGSSKSLVIAFTLNTEPVVRSYMSQLKKDVIFGIVDVGDRMAWKDQSCPFRTDPRLKLMVIPTIVVWKGVQRLEGAQCTKLDLLQMLFEDEE